MSCRVVSICLVIATAVLVTSFPNFELAENRYLPFFNLQADAFLNGRPHLDLAENWTHDVITFEGKKYFSLPPLNGLLLLPFVSFFGTQFSERIFTLFFYVAYLFLILHFISKCGGDRSLRNSETFLWLVFFGLGTDILTATAVGTAWFSAVLTSSFFLALSAHLLLSAKSKKTYVLSNLLLSLASLGRLHLILLAPIYLGVMWYRERPRPTTILVSCLPFATFIALIALWNYWRWGDPFLLNYRSHGYAAHFSSDIEAHGFTSISYIPRHLYHGLIAPLIPTLSPLGFQFDPNGNGLFATAPLFLTLIFRRQTYSKTDWIAVACIAIVGLVITTHFSTGWSQFGYRYTLDVFPFLAFLLLRAKFKICSPLGVFLVLISVLFRVSGTIAFLLPP